MGTVYLTGAGPGDIELLTLKAHRVISQADCIIYDRLAKKEILDMAKDGCEFIYVGKEDNKHTLPQEQINQVLYEQSKKHDIVVRLKGGDPFVFGRGGEEAIFLKEKGVKYEVIPGITSAISVPAYAGIPVTQRGVSASFRVVTGHEAKKDKSQVNWESFKNNETIVFLMGYHRLEYITSKLKEIGKAPNTPIAIISNGTRSNQKVVIGDLTNIVQKAQGLPTPAMIIVGEVVKLRDKIKWFDEE